jgi:adenosine deaminase CECR1
VFGPKHIEEMVDCMRKSRKMCEMIAGFDMVNEEDATAPLKDFVEILMESNQKLNNDCCFYFHGNIIYLFMIIAGESTHKVNENLYDAVMLGSKRIGHGFNLAMHPYL